MSTEQSRRQELLERYLASATPARVAGMPAADRTRPLTLSLAQQRMWFLDKLRPGGVEYVVTSAWRLLGVLDVDRLRACWRTIVARHEILRTTYSERDGVPEQIVGPPGEVDLTVVDVREGDVAEVTRAEAAVPFDLERDSPLRVRVLRLSATEHVLLLVVHHIAYDGWSASIVTRELAALYDGGELPDPVVQYAEFAAWHREHTSGDAVAAQVDYWRRRLDGVRPLTLPTDRPRPPVHDPRGDLVRFTVDAGLAGGVAELGKAHRATTFMVLLAAYQLLLGRYSGQDDVTVGSPIAGRTRAETQDLIGLFLNTLVLRAELDGSSSFTEFLAGVRGDTLEAYANQDAPFERLADELAPDRDLSRNPLFQAMLVVQNTGRAEFTAGGLHAEPVHSPWHSAKFDLTLELIEQPDGTLAGVLEYPVALFDRATVERLGGHFVELLRGIVANPGTRLVDLPWLSGAEHRQLARWNKTEVPFTGATLLDLVAEGMAGGGVAVVSGELEVTYAELEVLSNKAARRLRALGVGPEAVVGVRLERGVELVVTLLGILKAGGAYLPLDPEYPPDRLRFMAEDSGARVVITPGMLTDLDESGEPLDTLAGKENAAYVIYTSGSTGRPKGVVVPHEGIVNRLLWMQAEYGLTSADRVLQKTPFGFDVSVWEFFWTLSVGATLVMARPGGHRDPAYLTEVLVEQGITTAHFVPSMLRAFLAQPVPSLPLQRVLCSGEALPDDLVTRFADTVGCALHNLYGPTEASVDVTAIECHPGEPVTIGRAIANTRVHVVDRALREVPVGVPGELVIAGIQLARGYLNRPSLTAEKFVPNPFAVTPGERLYRTGDLARRLPDGRVAYLGRIDHQVKIHGNRIELGEIEATLAEHPDVQAAAAAVHDDRLVGYFVPEPGCAPTSADLRAHLARTLPEPMLPAIWLALDALPLTASGKTDRGALPAPDSTRTELAGEFVAPRTAAEEAVARAFALAVGVDRVGAEDNFFELGGDSLRAIRVIGLLRAEGVEAGVQDLFRRQRVAEFAAGLSGAAVAPTVSAEPFSQLSMDERASLPGDVTDAYPLSLAQAGMVHEMLAGADRGLYLNNLGYPVHDDGEFSLTALRQATNRLVERHEILRTSIDFTGVTPLQLVHRGATLDVTCDDLRELSPEDQKARVRRFLEEDRARGFDLLRPSLLRLHVHRLAEREWRLSVSYVHAILDGWSQNSLVAELLTDYRAVRTGTATPVEPPAARFADAIARERESLHSTVDRDFWSAKVAAADRFAVPPGWAGEDDGIYRTVQVPFADLTADLRAVAASAGVPLKSLLLAAHLTVLRTISGHDRPFHTGVVTNGRLETDGSDQVRGMFLNTVPFLAPAPETDWPGLARAVFAEETAFWPHRHFPLPEMQAVWGGQSPLVDVFFNHTDMHVLSDGGVDLDEVADSTPNEFGLSVSTVPGAFVLEAFTHRIAAGHLDFLSRLYRHVLERIVAAPGADPRRCGLPPADREALVRIGNPARIERAGETLPALFAAAAAANPDAPAVRCGDVTLTYRELDRRVTRLAGHLRERGVRRGSLVGVLLERRPEMLVSLLAVHRAGAVYLPIDPRYPAQRVEYVLDDSAVEVVLTQSSLAGLLGDAGRTVVLVEDHPSPSKAHDPTRPDGDELAYVIYTSGSTGRPKGVMIGHAALANFLLSMRERPGLASGASVLALTTISFDISALELYLPLLVGGQVVLATTEESVDPQAQAALIERARPSTVQATPSGLRLLLDSGWTPPPGLTVFAGGEKLPGELARRLTEGGAALWDLYGPTETTIWSTVAELDGDRVSAWEPVANTDVRLLDGELEPVPLGVVGEVYLGGDGLARGYAGRPGLTAERFVPDPYSTRPGARLYRTGDLARRSPEGQVEILGRVDHQVKIRGHRVEPGEIEALLLADPRVRDAVVQPASSPSGGLELTAYVVPADGAELSTADVRTGLARNLPDYLVPSGLVLLDEFPLTPAGKLDRAALPAPGPAVAEREHLAPRNPAEALVAGVWAEVLGVERVGVRDDFFDIGGHSVVATRIAVRLRSALRVDVPVRALFDHPTVEALTIAVTGYPPLAAGPGIRAAIRPRAAIRQTVGEDA